MAAVPKWHDGRMQVVYTAAHLGHDPKTGIEQSGIGPAFEHIGRAEAIRETLEGDDRFEFVMPTDHGLGPIEEIHDVDLVRFLATGWAEYQADVGPTADVTPDVFYRPALRAGMSERGAPASINGRLGWYCFETTTPLTEHTYDAARSAVDTALTTTDLVLGGQQSAYGLCRPPGHHATSGMYGGYCFFNNAAIAANHITRTTGTKVTVLDVDYHHGNGTQQIFYARDDVQYVSLHGDPTRAYPYNIGYADETGAGRGLGHNINMPLPIRTDDDDYIVSLRQAMDRIQSFGPSTLIVSLGLDTFISDPISDLAITAEGFERCGAAVAEMGVPTVVLQEGGYDVSALGDNVRRWLIGLGA
ncbi:MAG: histone deacetylase family protein [Ilumatobacteraceae bacterium]